MADETDNLMDDVRAAMTEVAGGDPPPPPETTDVPEAPPETPSEPQPGRARDENGRFAKQEGERQTLTLKKPTEQAAAVQQAPANAPAEPPPVDHSKQPIAAPMEWKGAAKVKWDRLPREVQAEIAERHQALEAARAETVPVKELIDANREFLVNEAGSVAEAFRQMVQFARMSNTVDGARQLALHILQRQGLDPVRAFGGQPGQSATPQPQDPTALVDQLVQQRLQPFLAQVEQRESKQLQDTIQAFAADPKHPYFNDVRESMGILLREGRAQSMEDAYDQAIWASPTIRQQLLAAQAEEAKRNQAAEVERANRARAASLRGSPLPNVIQGAGPKNATVQDDVRAAMAELAGA